mmetsp:Transcript_56246/g.180567  ORF Transcript_56246/g.180567 Transcript_56246/m.180567 type:complete len:209 (+) Transcript_56246:1363-1989(+)
MTDVKMATLPRKMLRPSVRRLVPQPVQSTVSGSASCCSRRSSWSSRKSRGLACARCRAVWHWRSVPKTTKAAPAVCMHLSLTSTSRSVGGSAVALSALLPMPKAASRQRRWGSRQPRLARSSRTSQARTAQSSRRLQPVCASCAVSRRKCSRLHCSSIQSLVPESAKSQQTETPTTSRSGYACLKKALISPSQSTVPACRGKPVASTA